MIAPTPTPDRITLSVTLAASPETVWWALTEGRSRWWSGLSFEPIVGSLLVESWVDESGEPQEAHGLVTSAEDGCRLCFDWVDPDCEAPLSVQVQLRPAEHGTQVDLTETGFGALADGAELRQEHTLGWMEHLRDLDLAVTRPA